MSGRHESLLPAEVIDAVWCEIGRPEVFSLFLFDDQAIHQRFASHPLFWPPAAPLTSAEADDSLSRLSLTEPCALVRRKRNSELYGLALERLSDGGVEPLAFSFSPLGELSRRDKILPIRTAPRAARTDAHFRLRGKNEVRLPFRFPAVVKCELAGRGGQRILEIVSGEPRAPEPAAFELPQDSVPDSLIVDVAYRVGVWDWRVWWCDGPASPNLAPAEWRKARRRSLGSGQPLEVALVFDRTCCDRASWFLARKLLRDPESVKGEMQQRAAEKSHLAEVVNWNKQLRSIAADWIKHSVGGGRVSRLHVLWTADVAGDLYFPSEHGVPGLAASSETWGIIDMIDSRNASSAEKCLDNAGYVPGIDLYDPVSEAVCEGIGRLIRTPPAKKAIVILGDSPPTPRSNDDPLKKSIERRLPQQFSARHLKDDLLGWEQVLEQAARMQIRVFYIFIYDSTPLEGTSIDPQERAEASQAVEMHNRLKNAVIDGLEESLRRHEGKFIVIGQEPDKISKALDHALDILKNDIVNSSLELRVSDGGAHS